MEKGGLGGLRRRSLLLFCLIFLVDNRKQRQQREAHQRSQNIRAEDNTQIRILARIENGPQARADRGKDECTRDESEESSDHICDGRNTEKRGNKIDQPERERWDQPQHQEVAQGVLAEAALHLGQKRVRLGPQYIAECRPRDQKQGRRAERRTDYFGSDPSAD